MGTFCWRFRSGKLLPNIPFCPYSRRILACCRIRDQQSLRPAFVLDVLPWCSLLLLFEGTEVTIRRPRTEFPTDQNYKVFQPVFITSVGKLHNHDEEEQKMMDGRLRFFNFSKTLPAHMRRKLEPCASCFATLMILLTEPPAQVLQISTGACPDSTSCCSSSQGSSSSQSSRTLPYCGDCGLLSSSSNFCTATGRKHC